MRQARYRPDEPSHYHVYNRAYNGEFRFDDDYKDLFIDLMWRSAAFSGVSIHTHNVMDNHFHIQVFENEASELSDEVFIERLHHLYKGRELRRQLAPFKRLLARDQRRAADDYKSKFMRRMNSVSEFMKTLKQRFTQIYNRREKRKGTFWEDRFHSILIEAHPGALAVMAAYIDLNPLRAGMVDDPLKHRWSGYASAVAGNKDAQNGLRQMLSTSSQFARHIDPDSDWDTVQRTYRKWLYAQGAANTDERGGKLKKGFTAEQIREALESGGTLPLASLLRCRLHAMIHGVAFGSRQFIESKCADIHKRLDWKRSRKPQSISVTNDIDLTVMRL